MNVLPLSEAYQLIEPGPVALLATARQGKINVMTFSWHMMVEFEPPLVACVVSAGNFSFAALRATGECVIAVPDARLASKVVKVGNSSGRDVDKFTAFGLTPVPAASVQAPLIAECFANLECRVMNDAWVERYNVFMLEVVKAWVEGDRARRKMLHHQGYGRFAVDGRALQLPSRMR